MVNVTLCQTVCGDGIWAGTEECDDNNTIDNDGCSSLCVIESAYYCLNVNLSTSRCSPCTTGCLNCSSDTLCTLCDLNYNSLTNATDTYCDPDCSNISLCLLCHVLNSTVQCDTCSTGYSVDNNTCSTVCGDGLVLGQE